MLYIFQEDCKQPEGYKVGLLFLYSHSSKPFNYNLHYVLRWTVGNIQRTAGEQTHKNVK